MKNITNAIAIAALVAGFSVAGTATALAATESNRNTNDTTTTNTGGAQSKRSSTNGSTAIHTAPRTTAKVNTYDSGVLWNPMAD